MTGPQDRAQGIPLIGYGGKGGGGGGLSEDPDTLKSSAYAQVLLALGEGEIEGPVDDAKSIYLDGTPLQNADGSTNFTVSAWQWLPGTQGQQPVPGFSDTESETVVGVEVTHATPITRTITDPNVDAVRVTLSVPQLYETHADGHITGTSVTAFIQTQSAGGGYVLARVEKIEGKSTGNYQRACRIDIRDLARPVDIRVVRDTDDNSSGTLQNHLHWDSYTQIIDVQLAYPNTALAAFRVDAAQFDHVPNIGLLCKLLRVRIPVNYDPVARTCTGTWDGTFKIAWTDNPAWCFYDLVTATRYGLGDYVPEDQVDKWALYAIAQYCDQPVPDGKGGTEPRFTCNLYLQTRAEAYTVLNQFASIFRAMMYWAGGALTAVQDAPADPVALYTNANVVDGSFTYAGTAKNTRHTVALVSWNNPANLYQQSVEYVEDRDGIDRYGVVETEVMAVGCTSQGQAQRVGRWLLYSERLQTETCAFTVGLEGILCRPGQIIQVADANRAGARHGGRILAATPTQVTLDAPVTLSAGQSYTLSIIGADGAIADRPVQAATGSTDTLTLATALEAAPVTGAIWVLSSQNLQPQSFRVLAVAESDSTQYQITALAHDPGKYAAVENDTVLVPQAISLLNAPLPAPQNFRIDEFPDTADAGIVQTTILFGWDSVPRAAGYELTYRIAGGQPTTVRVQGNGYEVAVRTGGVIDATVCSVNMAGVTGPAASKSVSVAQPGPIPAQLVYISVTPLDGSASSATTIPATRMTVFTQSATDADTDEPPAQKKTDIISISSGVTTATSAAPQVNPDGSRFDQFILPTQGTLVAQLVRASVINQYGNRSTTQNLLVPAVLTRNNYSSTGAIAIPSVSAVYRATTAAFASQMLTIRTVAISGWKPISSVALSSSGNTPAFGTPVTTTTTADGVTGIDSWSVLVTLGPFSATPETQFSSIFATVTFSDGSTCGVPFNFLAVHVAAGYGYLPSS